MAEIIDFKHLENYIVWLKFKDGFQTEINLRPMIGKGFAAELLDMNAFQKLKIEPGGGLAWENGFDICPNYLRKFAEQKKSVA